MNPSQIDELVTRLPPDVDARQRRRIMGYAAIARRCEELIRALRGELERAQRAVADVAATGLDERVVAAEALRVARELDALERVQPRVDAWLRVAAGSVLDQPGLEPFGEGPV
jgi:hypothetical protein